MSRPPADCHPNLAHIARGLCSTCYRKARHAGTLHLHQRKPKDAGNALRQAADHYRVTIPDIIGRDRHPYLIDARATAAQAMRTHVDMSLSAIGRTLDRRSIATVHTLLDYTPAPPDPARPPVDPGCCHVDGCGRDAQHTHMCSGHRMRWVRTGRIRPDQPLRPIRDDDAHIVDDPDAVHDRYLYTHGGCRCEDCRHDAVQAVKANRHRPQSRPLEHGLRALRPLLEAGMTVPQIAAAAGTGTATLYSWLKGRVDVAYQRTIDKVAAVEPPARIVAGARCVDCGGDPMPGGAARCLPCFQAWQRRRAS